MERGEVARRGEVDCVAVYMIADEELILWCVMLFVICLWWPTSAIVGCLAYNGSDPLVVLCPRSELE